MSNKIFNKSYNNIIIEQVYELLKMYNFSKGYTIMLSILTYFLLIHMIRNV